MFIPCRMEGDALVSGCRTCRAATFGRRSTGCVRSEGLWPWLAQGMDVTPIAIAIHRQHGCRATGDGRRDRGSRASPKRTPARLSITRSSLVGLDGDTPSRIVMRRGRNFVLIRACARHRPNDHERAPKGVCSTRVSCGLVKSRDADEGGDRHSIT